MTRFVQYLDEDTGASAAEYALILALIALVIIGSVTALGNTLNSVFGNEAFTFGSL
jgi:pilus assembly protein Flp/PilA